MALAHNETANIIERIAGFEVLAIKTRTWGDGNVLETSLRYRVQSRETFWDFTTLEAARRFLNRRLNND